MLDGEAGAFPRGELEAAGCLHCLRNFVQKKGPRRAVVTAGVVLLLIAIRCYEDGTWCVWGEDAASE